MPLSISIHFLTGRAHLHPWQAHHSEGRVEWPPSHWRLLRAFVAIAGRGLTTLPYPDEGTPLKPEPKATLEGISTLKKRGVPKDAQGKLSLSKFGVLSLKEPLTDAEADAWKLANPGQSFSVAIDQVRVLASAPEPIALADVEGDEIPLSRLVHLLAVFTAPPSIWLPKTAGGHTRQYFPIHDAGIVKNSGSAVFDTFATVRKDQPLVFHWPNVDLDARSQADLKLILGRLTYFGRAESWCRAESHSAELKNVPDVIIEGRGQTHWPCVCIEDGGKPVGKEYRDYTLERRLAPCSDVESETVSLLPRTKIIATDSRPKAEADFRAILNAEQAELSLLRCPLRESGQDIKDGLERPIGTRWIHYAVPREIYDVPRPIPVRPQRPKETVDLVVYALNTATVHRPVLPALTDTLLVADHFRSAVMALNKEASRNLSGHQRDGTPCFDHGHAFYWPMDEDNDGFIDHVMIHCREGFEATEIQSLRRLTRLRQRSNRPDLLVTPIFVGESEKHKKRISKARRFVSATPYFCPLHLSHGRNSGGKVRRVSPVIRDGLKRQGIPSSDKELEIFEIVFDFDIDGLTTIPNVVMETVQPAYPRACYKDPDKAYPFGLSIGLFVSEGTRFVRALSFCRNRRGRQAKGYGRMLELRFTEPQEAHPFAIGDQCHFGLGLFVPVNEQNTQSK